MMSKGLFSSASDQEMKNFYQLTKSSDKISIYYLRMPLHTFMIEGEELTNAFTHQLDHHTTFSRKPSNKVRSH
jgi:hypothetical protein